jgi:hypothetical protein
MTTTTYTITENTLALMLTENTGTHMLDSGGAYGRAWQRNAGKLTDDFIDEPETYCDGWGVTVSVFHYLRKRVMFSPVMQSRLDQFAETMPDESWFGIIQAFAESFEDSGAQSWNTYNDDGCALSQVLQGVTFSYGGDTYAVIQIHGGADVRGGYTKPQVFRVTVNDMADHFPYDHIEYLLECPEDSSHSVSWRGEWISWEGCSLDSDKAPLFDTQEKCVKCGECGTPMSPLAPEPY